MPAGLSKVSQNAGELRLQFDAGSDCASATPLNAAQRNALTVTARDIRTPQIAKGNLFTISSQVTDFVALSFAQCCLVRGSALLRKVRAEGQMTYTSLT